MGCAVAFSRVMKENLPDGVLLCGLMINPSTITTDMHRRTLHVCHQLVQHAAWSC